MLREGRSARARRAEEILALLFAAAVVVAGGAAIYFVSTISVHSDPAAVPSKAAATAERYASAVEEARRLARSLVVDQNLPGRSVAVGMDGEIAWAEGFGWADIARREPVTPVTRFRIGTVAIPLTSAAVGLLHDRGSIDLDAPVQRYLPEFPEKQWPISTRQVMGHVAGIRHGRGSTEAMPNRHCASIDQVLPVFSGDPLIFRPGTEYRYSTYDWILVSAVVEAAAKVPFVAFLNQEILRPLGMFGTVPDDTGDVSARTSFYFPRAAQRPDLGVQDAPSADYSCYAASGAFLSTPSDLVRFAAAMMKPGFLKPETVAFLQTPLKLESGASTNYALGWNVENVQLDGANARMVGHRGSSMGGTTSLMTFPDRGLSVAVTSNISYAKGIEPFGLKAVEAFSRLPARKF